jgi:hypothetical protein
MFDLSFLLRQKLKEAKLNVTGIGSQGTMDLFESITFLSNAFL